MTFQKSKLIRNLKQGDEFELLNSTRYPTQIIHARATRDAIETTMGFMTRRRRWMVSFEIISTSDGKPCYGWHDISGYSDDRIDLI
jgi:hypothetical protein